MNKPFNMRLPVLFAASLCAGIVYSTVLAYFRIEGIFIFIPALTAFAACVPVAIFKGGASKPLIIIFAALFFLAGAIYMYAKYLSFVSADVVEGIFVNVNAVVEEVGETASGSKYLILSRVSVNGEKINGKIAAYLTETTVGYCRRGYTVDIYVQLTKQNFIEYGSVGYNAVRNVRYVCTAGGNLNAAYRFNLFGEINYALENSLYSNLDKETAAVCLAMLTGNTDGISAGTLSSFRNGGIAHIFAVSGLHIGVIYGVFTFVFNKAGVNRFVSTAVRIAVISLYSGVCLFSPSSVRALIMCSVSAAAGCFHRKHDGLNALAVAAVVILLINPLYIYGVGFVLSFAAVSGILFLGNNFKRIFSFLPKKLASAISVGCSVQIATFPVQLTSFSYVSAAGLALNLLFIPLVSALYVMLFFCAVISAAIPAVGSVALNFSALPISFVINVVTYFGFENAVISGSAGHLIYLPFAVFIVGFSDKFNIRALYRTAAAFSVILLFICLVFATSVKSGCAIAEFGSGYSGGSVKIATDKGTVLVITENFRRRSNEDYGADAVVVLGGDDSLSAVIGLGERYKYVYVRGGVFYYPELGGSTVIACDSFTACGVDFVFCETALKANVYGTEISLVYENGFYNAGQSGSELELYCYGQNGGVLYDGKCDYLPDICGAMRYAITYTGYRLQNVVPRE